MKITVTYKVPQADGPDGKRYLVENYTSNRVTFPAEFPYVVIGAFPKRAGKSTEIFLPLIKELEITD